MTHRKTKDEKPKKPKRKPSKMASKRAVFEYALDVISNVGLGVAGNAAWDGIKQVVTKIKKPKKKKPQVKK